MTIYSGYRFLAFFSAGLLSTTSAYAQIAPAAPPKPTPEGTAAQAEALEDAQEAQGSDQARAGGSDADIIVTAQRRAERLQDVPIAVSAFTAMDLETRQITNTLDLISYVPNLIGHNNTALGTANTYSLRGLANTESIATFDPPVGTYVDDIYISRQGANNFAFFDVQRIEVLRGPQGTLFGRNTTGGAINVILKKPSNDVTGFLEAGYGRFDRTHLRGSVDLPIVSDKLLSKVSAYHIAEDGFVHNEVTGERVNDEKNIGLRFALRGLLTDSVTWDVAADYVHAAGANLPHFYDADRDRRITFIPFSTKTPIGPALVSSKLADNTLGNETDSYSVSSNLEIETGAATINIITGYRHLFQEFFTDSFAGLSAGSVVFDGIDFVSGTRGFSTPLVNDSTHKQFSQEIKVTGDAFDGLLTYVGGFYYLIERNDTNFANITVPLTGTPSVSGDRVVSNDTEAYAGYFQGDFHVTPELTLTAGIRYTDEHKDIGFSPNPNSLRRSAPRNQPFDTQDLVNAGIPSELRSKVWTPRLAIKYDLARDVMVYASATKGFKSGGWNARAFFPEGAVAFTRETIWSYEGGVRSEFLDRRLRANLTGFYFISEDLQLPGGGLDPVTNIITYLTRNVADLRNYGLEGEIAAVPIDGLNVYWSFGLQNARYQNLNQITQEQRQRCLNGIVANNCNAGIITPDGQVAEPTRAPSFTSTLGGSYSLEIGKGFSLNPSVNWNYVSGTWVSTSNDPRGFQPGHSIVNAGLTLRTGQGWSIGAECSNCFDKVYRTSFLIYPYLNQPGSWMVRARYDF